MSTKTDTQVGPSDPTEASDAERILHMIRKLPATARRTTVLQLQALLPSMLEEPGDNTGDPSDEKSIATTLNNKSIIMVKQRATPIHQKLRVFSGITPTPSGHLTFRTWHRAATRLCRSEELLQEEKLALIHNSLCQPALDLVQSSLDSGSPTAVLSLLEKAYGDVQHPLDLLNDFNKTMMKKQEKPSEYLSRLYLKLEELKGREVVQDSEVPSILLRQFNYGCIDENLMLKLRLEEKEKNPPDYGTLLLALRKEEARQKKKSGQMVAPTSMGAEKEHEIQKLSQEVKTLKAQLAATPKVIQQKGETASSPVAKPDQPPVGKKKPQFCSKCGNSGHLLWECNNTTRPRHGSRKFEQKSATTYMQVHSPSNVKSPDPTSAIPKSLVGDPNEVNGSVCGVRCTALVDTGSQVSTVAETFYMNHLSNLELHDCKNLLRVEGAGGDLIPYMGYIFANVGLEGVSAVEVPILIVKDTPYNAKVPLLVGTNYLQRMKNGHASKIPRVLQVAKQSVEVVQRHLEKSNGLYGTVYASEDTVIYPGHIQVLCGETRIAVPIPAGISMVSSPQHSTLDVTPGVINIDKSTRTTVVEVANNGGKDIEIRKGERIAELHQVTVNTSMDSSSMEDDFLAAFNLTYLEDNATPEETREVKDMITRWKHIFSKDSTDLGKTSLLKHRIDLHDNVPVKEKARRIPPNMIEEVRDHIQQLHSMGVIEESVSPWSSPIVLVRKKSGELRMCVDYRKLNQKTIRDSYRIPTIEELVDTLNGAKWFATLDLSSGYHQVEIEEADKEKTAFTAGPLGFWQYTRMPFGLTNAPALFQRLMERVLSGVHLRTALVYLDDIVVFGASIAELKRRLEEVFRKIEAAGLKLKAKKCVLFCQELKYLGHIVSQEGIRCDPEMLSPIKDWEPPKNVKELQKFLGFANFYRRFVEGFAKTAQPLTELLGGSTQKRGTKPAKVAKPWMWGMEQQTAFERLREALTSPPLLAYPDFSKPFILRTDASTYGLGAVLCQDNGDRAGAQVIAYASRTLKPSEKNYSPYKLEFLALFWAVTNKFQDYLKGATFTVWTDHNPLTYILTSAKLDSTGHRWLQQLSNFHFSIKYKPGRHNTDADVLSRMSEECVKTVCHSFNDTFDGFGQCMNVQVNHIMTEPSHTTSKLDWRQEQRSDPACRRVLEILQRCLHTKVNEEQAEVKQILRKRKQLCLEDGILYRKASDKVLRIFVPSHLRKKILTMCHEEMGHQGRDRTHAILHERFYWPSMIKSIEDHLLSCGRCIRAKSPHLPHKAPLHPIVSTEPLEIVCMDYMSLETSKGGYSSILVITDHFTKFAIAVPTRNQTAATTAKALLAHFIYPYGIPRRLHSDQGANFESRTIRKMCDMYGILKSRTTPYHPEGDGQTERMNRTLLNMLRTLNDSGKQDWKAHVNRLLHAYNTTPHSSTGYSPYYLLFGRKPTLPVDALLPNRRVEPKSMNALSELQETHKTAKENNDRARRRQKKGYDINVRGGALEVGDHVLVKKLAFKGTHKLEDKWEQDAYTVVEKANPEIPVYKVESEDGKQRTLHRNHLQPLYIASPCENATSSSKPRKAKSPVTSNKSAFPTEVENLDDSDSERFDNELQLTQKHGHPITINQEGGTPTASEGEETEDTASELVQNHNESQHVENAHIEDSESTSGSEHIDNTDESESEHGHEQSLSEDEEHISSNTSEIDSPPALPRRSTRLRRPPDRYGLAISHQQTVQVADLKERVHLLGYLADVFPNKSEELFNHAVKLLIA